MFSKVRKGASPRSAELTRRQVSLGLGLDHAGSAAAAASRGIRLPRFRSWTSWSACFGPCQPRAVKLQRLHDLHHILPRLGEGDALDPVDRVDLRIARVAELLHPVGDPAAAGVIGGERQEIGAVIAVDQLAEMRLAELGVVGGIGQLVGVELDLVGVGDRSRGARHQLHQARWRRPGSWRRR